MARSTCSDLEDLEEMLKRKKEKRIELLRRIHTVRSKKKRVYQQNQAITDLQSHWLHRFKQSDAGRRLAISEYLKEENDLRVKEADYEKLSQINVLQDVFHIWYRGSFATFNGLRVGMCVSPPSESSNQPAVSSNNLFWSNNNVGLSNKFENAVPWHEINAGVSMIALLIQNIQKKLRIQHQSRYIILPRGSTTRISSRKTKQEWELFHQPSTFQFFARRNWNAALNILGFCLFEIVKELIHIDGPRIQIPYDVVLDDDWSNERIGSVKVGSLDMAFNGDGIQWTNAMKFVAIDLKLIVAIIAKHAN